jgi:hypothetical protein
MSARYLTDYPLDGYLHTRQSPRVALRRNKFNLRPLFESVGWVVAGAGVGIAAVMIGAWGLLQLTEPRVPHAATAMAYEIPALTQNR